MTEFYVGLAAVLAGLQAILAAALLVLAQSASQTYTPAALQIVLRDWAVRWTFLVAFVVTSFSLAAAALTAYPHFDAIRYTDTILSNGWTAVGLSGATLVSALLGAVLLVKVAEKLEGSALIRLMVETIDVRAWVDWIDFADPPPQPGLWQLATRASGTDTTDTDRSRDDGGTEEPTEEEVKQAIVEVQKQIGQETVAYEKRQGELRQRHAQGKLSDPFASIFEAAVTAVEARRYPMLDVSLNCVSRRIDDWYRRDKTLDSRRGSKEIYRHCDELIEVALSVGAPSQIDTVMRQVRELGVAALRREDSLAAYLALNDLEDWARLLTGSEHEWLVSKAIAAICVMGTSALEARDQGAFDEAALALGRIGEALASAYVVGQRRPLLQDSIRDRGREKPVDAIQEAFYQLAGAATNEREGKPLYPGRLAVAARVTAEAFLAIDGLDEHADSIASEFIRPIKQIGFAAIDSADGDLTLFVAHELKWCADPAAKVKAKRTLEALAWAGFEAGMATEAKIVELKFERGPFFSDPIQVFIEVCALSGEDAMKGAIPELFDRGHTMYIPGEAQERFLAGVEAKMGRSFERYR